MNISEYPETLAKLPKFDGSAKLFQHLEAGYVCAQSGNYDYAYSYADNRLWRQELKCYDNHRITICRKVASSMNYKEFKDSMRDDLTSYILTKTKEPS